MEDAKIKEQLFGELDFVQKDIEGKGETRDCFISRFQLLVQNCGLFSRVIDNLPYPVAVFGRSGALLMANHMLMKEAGIKTAEISAGKINFLDRVTDENYAVFEAAEDVFWGETTVVRPLFSPLALFCRDDIVRAPDTYQTAVFFPAGSGDGEILRGAVVLMR